MQVAKRVELGEGAAMVVVDGQRGLRIVINGNGSYASLSPLQARALFGALRDLDNEGLLDDDD